MAYYKWLTTTEAANYLRRTESYLMEIISKGEGPLHSDFDGQLLFNTDQLDEFLFNKQVESIHQQEASGTKSNSEPGSSLPIQTLVEDHKYGDSAEYQELTNLQDFMQQACSLWDDGELFTAHFRTKGASCQCQGEPRLWVFEAKFQVPSDDHGNDLYEPIRTALRRYFPQVTGKATVHIKRSGFSWHKFKDFIRDVKEISRQALAEKGLASTSYHSEGTQEENPEVVYEKCISLWEDPPDFTIVYGTRGCSARYKAESRLWFFQNYIRIPAESQNNPLVQEIIGVKKECFPGIRTKTKIPFKTHGISWPEIEAFIQKVKSM